MREELERAVERCGLEIRGERRRGDRYILDLGLPGGIGQSMTIAFDAVSLTAAGAAAEQLFRHEIRSAQEWLLLIHQLDAVRGLHPGVVFVARGAVCPLCALADSSQTITSIAIVARVFRCTGASGDIEHAFPPLTALARDGLLTIERGQEQT